MDDAAADSRMADERPGCWAETCMGAAGDVGSAQLYSDQHVLSRNEGSSSYLTVWSGCSINKMRNRNASVARGRWGIMVLFITLLVITAADLQVGHNRCRLCYIGTVHGPVGALLFVAEMLSYVL